MEHTFRQVLLKIRSRDPQGWTTRNPTDADDRAFKAWVIATYDEETWRTYEYTNWDEPDNYQRD